MSSETVDSAESLDPDVWVSQTALGEQFGWTSKDTGAALALMGLRKGPEPTSEAMDHDLARPQQRDGGRGRSPYIQFLWHQDKVSAMIAAFARTQGGFRPLTEQLRGSVPSHATTGFGAVRSAVHPISQPLEHSVDPTEPKIQPAEVSEPVRPYDPADHGYQPHSLEEVVDFAALLTSSLGEFQEMLLGCTVPLNLRGASKAVQKCLIDLGEVFGHLAEARLIIEADLPIAAKFGAAPTAAWNPSGERGPHILEPGELLSPKQIHTLRQILQDHPEYPRTTYSAQLAQGHNVPPLVVDQAKAKKAATARAERQAAETAAAELVPAVLADVESRVCPRCDAEADQYCRTSTGRIAEKPHAGRIKLSPLAADNPNVVEVLSRQTEAYEEFAGRPWPYS